MQDYVAYTRHRQRRRGSRLCIRLHEHDRIQIRWEESTTINSEAESRQFSVHHFWCFHFFSSSHLSFPFLLHYSVYSLHNQHHASRNEWIESGIWTRKSHKERDGHTQDLTVRDEHWTRKRNNRTQNHKNNHRRVPSESQISFSLSEISEYLVTQKLIEETETNKKIESTRNSTRLGTKAIHHRIIEIKM